MSRPDATSTASVTPWTCTGVRRTVRVPSPSWPSLFRPHEKTRPSAHRARLLLCPAATWLTPPAPHGTLSWVGTLRFAVPPTPSWPFSLLPHTYTWPEAVRATMCSRPPSISTTSETPATAAGPDGEAETVPLPSWPKSLDPQVQTVLGATAAPAGDGIHASGTASPQATPMATRRPLMRARALMLPPPCDDPKESCGPATPSCGSFRPGGSSGDFAFGRPDPQPEHDEIRRIGPLTLSNPQPISLGSRPWRTRRSRT